MPEPRSGHSAVTYRTFMYIFGGKNNEDEKLNDLWQYSFTESLWTKIQAPNPPLSRSGHTCNVFNDRLIIFGGIHEVTKELDDMHCFNFKS